MAGFTTCFIVYRVKESGKNGDNCGNCGAGGNQKRCKKIRKKYARTEKNCAATDTSESEKGEAREARTESVEGDKKDTGVADNYGAVCGVGDNRGGAVSDGNSNDMAECASDNGANDAAVYERLGAIIIIVFFDLDGRYYDFCVHF